jgi:hypothetical protein
VNANDDCADLWEGIKNLPLSRPDICQHNNRYQIKSTTMINRVLLRAVLSSPKDKFGLTTTGRPYMSWYSSLKVSDSLQCFHRNK